jgi:ATP-dependent helicase/nuclease subunit B
MRAATGRQQRLRLHQLERGRARQEQQYPAHQQVGDPPLHISSLHANASTLESVTGPRAAAMPLAMRELLDRGGVILTANARAARALERRYASLLQTGGAAAWLTPHILDLHSWLTEQWQLLLLTGTEDRLLLNDLQEQAAWQFIMQPEIEGRSLIEPARLATQAQQAYALLAEYGGLGRLSGTAWPSDLSEPTLFRRWGQLFQQECARRHWLPRCELADAIAHALRMGLIPAPREIGWLGFDRPTPADGNLRAALDERGTVQRTLHWDADHVAVPLLYTAKSEPEEIRACAVWAREQLARRPEARIGILLPDVTSRRAALERALLSELSPQRFPITAGGAPVLPFEFSLGQPLAEVPLIHAALLLLRWLEEPLTQQEISWLLLSSTLRATQGEAVRHSLAQWDAAQRRLPCPAPSVSLDTYLRHGQQGRGAVVELGRDLRAMLQTHRGAARPALPGGWAARIGNLLGLAGWGQRSDASSLLYQARDAWDRLLDLVASLDYANRRLSYADLRVMLERAAHATIFAAESAAAPVQVIGAFAASGQAFDAVWFLGATDAAWPASGRPHPLLPIRLQRELGMPHTSAAEETALAHRMMERILDGSNEVVFSYAQQSAESIQRPSSLISRFAPLTMMAAAKPQDTITLDPVDDVTWVPFTGTVAPGGQRALKHQADCPFQAFALLRLRIDELPIAGRGLSPATRGNLVHRVLERVWSRDTGDHLHLQGHAGLLAARASGTLRPLVAAHATAEIDRLAISDDEAWQRAYLDAEKTRLIAVVMEWLDYEAERQPFTVAAVEETVHLQVGELALKVRIDRIDEVAGGKLLIDYKTGEVSPNSWEGARLDQPQLPLYAAYGGTENLVGAVFAQVRRPDPIFKGRVADAMSNLAASLKEDDKQIAPYTPDVVEEWRSALEQLAAGFARGEAVVDPRSYPKTCRFCELPGLCRIAEQRGSESLAAEDEGEPGEA